MPQLVSRGKGSISCQKVSKDYKIFLVCHQTIELTTQGNGRRTLGGGGGFSCRVCVTKPKLCDLQAHTTLPVCVPRQSGLAPVLLLRRGINSGSSSSDIYYCPWLLMTWLLGCDIIVKTKYLTIVYQEIGVLWILCHLNLNLVRYTFVDKIIIF